MKVFPNWVIGFCASWFCLVSDAAEFRALWVAGFSPYDSNRVATVVADARAGHFNALVPLIRSGYCYYNTRLEVKSPTVSPPDFDPLADMIARAHDTNSGPRLKIHPWVVIFPIWLDAAPPSDPNHPFHLHPDWLMKESDGGILPGGRYRWDPGHPQVQQHMFDVCMEIITNYDVDGLNFDNIRYAGLDTGYNDVSVARFNSRFGRTGQPAINDTLWTQFRRDQVTALVRKVYLSAIAIKPDIVISADTITGGAGITNETKWLSSSAYSSLLQDWRGWMEEGILDLNIPMAYADHTVESQSFLDWNMFTKNHRYGRHAAIGLGLYRNTISNNIVQCRITREPTTEGNHGEGLCGYVYNSSNNEGQPLSVFLNALTQTNAFDPLQPPLFAEEDVPPVMPWKIAPTNGHLKGFVFDEKTNCLDGAVLTLTGPVSRNLTNDATGFFGSAHLPPGNYLLAASFPAYGSATQSVTITAGTVTHKDFVLQPTGIAFVLQPQDRTALVGSNATVTARAVGIEPLTYQWFFNGAMISGATSQTLVLTTVVVGHAGAYRVVASNPSGSVTSLVATLSVQYPIQINVSGNGIVSRKPEQAGYNLGSRVFLSAVPAVGHAFTGWTGDVSNWFNPLTVTVTNVVSLTAHFAASPYDLIIDNESAAFTGSWTLTSLSTNRYGANYHYASTATATPTATATYRPRLPLAGNYDVFLWYVEGPNRATNVPWTIVSGGSSIKVVVDQTTGGSNWLKIAAARYFDAGTNSFVRLENNTGLAGKVAVADAVRFAWSRTQPISSLRLAPSAPNALDPLAVSALGNDNQSWLLEYTTNWNQWQAVNTFWTSNPVAVWIDPAARIDAYRFYRARQANVFQLTDFETNASGSAVLFRISGTTAQFVDPDSPNFTVVTNQFPGGKSGGRVLQTTWSCIEGTNGSLPWLRLSASQTVALPNPTVGLQQIIGFTAWASRDLYLAAGIRETSTSAVIGANGGSSGPIEWIGGITDNTTYPPKGRFIPAGQWVWVNFCIPGEPTHAYTGDGYLDSTTGKAVFEELAIVPADGGGPYTLYLDDFHFFDTAP